MMKAARHFKPDKIVILGDYADFYAVSSFEKHPKRMADLAWEVEDVNRGLDELDDLGATTKIFVSGNHEDRLERYMVKSAPALFGCVSVPELFKLADRGWHHVPYKRSFRLGKLRLTHDTGTAGINAHRQSMDAFQGSVVIGHTHRMEVSYKGNADGPPQVGAMFGWLGDFDQIDYMHAIQAKRAWVHGFGIGYQEPNGVIHLSAVPIVGGRCVVAGKLIR
jgi:predicted phosphodiesterase